MTDKILVVTTCGTLDEAERLARHLVERRIAACVQISPGIRSYYRWQGQLTCDEEFRLSVKTRRDLFQPLCDALRQVHSYQVPQIVAIPIVEAADSYLQWMDHELQPPRNL